MCLDERTLCGHMTKQRIQQNCPAISFCPVDFRIYPHPKDMSGTCPGHVWDMSRTLLGHVQDNSNLVKLDLISAMGYNLPAS